MRFLYGDLATGADHAAYGDVGNAIEPRLEHQRPESIEHPPDAHAELTVEGAGAASTIAAGRGPPRLADPGAAGEPGEVVVELGERANAARPGQGSTERLSDRESPAPVVGI